MLTLGLNLGLSARNQGGGGSAPASIASVVSSAVFDVDATVSASYSGSGTTLANLVASPANGDTQSAYDFQLGDGSTSSTYPTFTGTAGDAAAYFSHDGGDYFSLAGAATSATLLNELHNTSGDDWWMAIAFRASTFSSTTGLFGTYDNNAEQGVISYIDAAGNIRLIQRAGSNSTAVLGTATNSADNIIIISHSFSTNVTRYWVNSTTGVDVAHTFNTATSNAGLPINFAAGFGTVYIFPNLFRTYGHYGGNEFLDNTKAASIISFLETRHGRDYTP